MADPSKIYSVVVVVTAGIFTALFLAILAYVLQAMYYQSGGRGDFNRQKRAVMECVITGSKDFCKDKSYLEEMQEFNAYHISSSDLRESEQYLEEKYGKKNSHPWIDFSGDEIRLFGPPPIQ